MNNIIRCTLQVELIFFCGIFKYMPGVLPLRVAYFKPDNYFFKSTMTCPIYQTYLTRDLHLRGKLVFYRLFFYNFMIYVRESNDS